MRLVNFKTMWAYKCHDVQHGTFLLLVCTQIGHGLQLT